MAVQAPHPSNVRLFNRNEQQERKEMDYSQAHQPPGLHLDQPPLFSVNDVTKGNQRKRGREPSASATASGFQMVPTPQMNLFSSPAQSPALVSLAQLQQTQSNHHHSSLVSTGLRLSFEDDNQTQNQWQRQFHQQDLASLIDGQNDEFGQYLVAQGERLRRTLADRRQIHYRALLAVAEASASRRLMERDIELERAVRQAAELEDRIARLRTESLTWQARAMAGRATAATLHAHIQQAQMAAAAAGKKQDECGESEAEDAGSAHVDPERVEHPRRACRACGVSAVSVVLLPCRHLCLCSACDGDSDAACCPVCHAVRTGSVQVFLP